MAQINQLANELRVNNLRSNSTESPKEPIITIKSNTTTLENITNETDDIKINQIENKNRNLIKLKLNRSMTKKQEKIKW